MASMKRRDFLRLSGTFLVAAKLTGCGGDDDGATPDGPGPDAPTTGIYRYPQGVASGDPRETSVVLWTRAERVAGGTADIELKVEVATDEAFTNVVAMRDLWAAAANDHTVRVIVTDLAADTIYFYRFTTGNDVIVGRTRTAPTADADVPIRLAWASCQDYMAGHYGAYRIMIQEDMARPPADQIRAVLHLGDFIYETRRCANAASMRALKWRQAIRCM
jgi:alkaline phosphatase D